MNFNELTGVIQNVHVIFERTAKQSINVCVTARNWLLGYYIQEYELGGADRSQYGEDLLRKLSESLRKIGVTAISDRSLRVYKQFYQLYPHIWQAVLAKLQESSELGSIPAIWQAAPAKLQKQIEPDLPFVPTEVLVKSLSFTHFVELMKINDPYKRCFYEYECIKGHWTTRNLKRQINSLCYERTTLSKDKNKLIQALRNQLPVQDVTDVIKDPYVFEFLGFKPKEVMYESDLSNALLEKLQEFLLELGKGFCFEDRNKRILIGDEFYFIDMVFYHRIIKSHIIIELKLNAFNHENVGQLKTYLNYYKKNEMTEGDNPPIGILLCTEKNHALVEYALGDDNNNQLFVSEYQLKLPSKQEMKVFLEKELAKEMKNFEHLARAIPLF